MAEENEVKKGIVSIGGREYVVSDLNDAAKSQLANISYVDKELEELKNRTAVLQAAKQFYIGQLTKELPSDQ